MAILPTSASLLLTEDCNLRCTYCFEKHNKAKMSKETARKSIDFLAGNAIRSGSRTFSVLLFGGEPFLNIPVVAEVLKYGYDMARKNHLEFSVSAVTNATVMTDALYDVLREYRDKVNLNIQLSVDGIPMVQDRYRLTVAGNGSWNLIEKNIPLFQKLYDDDPNDKRLHIHGCLNKDTLPFLYKSYSFFRHQLNFKSIWFLCVAEEDWDRRDVDIYRRQNQMIFDDYIAEMQKSKEIQDSFNYAPFDRYTCMDERAEYPCGAGRNFVTIAADGGIYPCHQIYFNDADKDTLIGSVLENFIDEDRRRIFLDYDESDLGCGDCANKQCYRCLATNWVHQGGIFNQVRGIYCDLASVDREFQQKVREAVARLFGSGVPRAATLAPDCLCNCREGLGVQGCDVVFKQDHCQSGNDPENPDCLYFLRQREIDSVMQAGRSRLRGDTKPETNF